MAQHHKTLVRHEGQGIGRSYDVVCRSGFALEDLKVVLKVPGLLEAVLEPVYGLLEEQVLCPVDKVDRLEIR